MSARVFDCFPFFNELDILELHLETYAELVHRFVILEAAETYQGGPKPFHFEESRSRFDRFADKIVHVKVGPAPPLKPLKTKDDNGAFWAREFYQRNKLSAALRDLARPEDLILYTDVDEIIRPDVLADAVTNRAPDELTMFELTMFRFAINRRLPYHHPRAPDLGWIGPRMVSFRNFGTARGLRESKPFVSARLRGSSLGALHTRLYNFVNYGYGGPVKIMRDAGWHFSSFGSWSNFRRKVESFSHSESKSDAAYLDEKAFLDFIRGETVPVSAKELPSFVVERPDLFPFFEDVEQTGNAVPAN